MWLCRPGLANDPCTANLAATVEPGPSPTSSTTVQPNPPPTTPAIDCFYVYPTVSTQATTNANLHIDPAERLVAEAQASPFAPNCRIFAPMYRQLTLGALEGTSGVARANASSVALAYSDVLAAWQYYLAHDNAGRGVVFIGHSQGSSMLIRLLHSQVDPSPAERRLLVSAIILGGNVEVPVGQGVGGSFQNIPACNSTSATGCVVAYSSFSQTPPANSLFARAGTGVSLVSGQPPGPSSAFQVLCVNPTSLSSPATPGPLEPYFPTSASGGRREAVNPVGHLPEPVHRPVRVPGRGELVAGHRRGSGRGHPAGGERHAGTDVGPPPGGRQHRPRKSGHPGGRAGNRLRRPGDRVRDRLSGSRVLMPVVVPVVHRPRWTDQTRPVNYFWAATLPRNGTSRSKKALSG